MKITLITGAANGLGKSFAKLYAKDNNNLLLIDIDEISLNETINELKNEFPNILIDSLIVDLNKIEELIVLALEIDVILSIWILINK